MKFEMVKNMLNEVMYYKSDMQIIIRESQLGAEFNECLPKYIIVKNGKTYDTYRIESQLTDWMQLNIYICNLESIFQNYKRLWSGFDKLKDAKEYIEETEKEEQEY